MNIYKKFYRDYYPDNIYANVGDEKVSTTITRDNDPIKRTNDRLCITTLTEDMRAKQENYAADKKDSFVLEVAYPGLITGIGLNHGIGGIDSEFKHGMHFDYTTGMPVIYGSTVKGVLKSSIKHYEEYEALRGDIADLEREIFKGLKRVVRDGEDIYEPMPICDRDIFFDAVIVEAAPGGTFLECDTICPHKDNPLKNPNPVSFIKIAPGVKFEFRFNLKDSELMSAEDKRELFITILRDWGIGAKTNVGYGQFL